MKRKAMFLWFMTMTLLMSAGGNYSQGNQKTTEETFQENKVQQKEKGQQETYDAEEESEDVKRLNVQIGKESFTLTLEDNKSTKAFEKMLPLTLDMDELNGNEKYFYLEDRLPNRAKSVESIQNGDFMLYGSDCLVLFYESFSTGYAYTRLGKIDNPERLAEVLGSGSVTVSFSSMP